MAAAGLWTTATDLAKFGIEIALSKQGKANHVLSAATTREMLKPQIEQVGSDSFSASTRTRKSSDTMATTKAFKRLLIMFADSGKGVAIMGNSDNAISVGNQLMQSVAKEYGWNYTPDPMSAADLLMLVADSQRTGGRRRKIFRAEKSRSRFALYSSTKIL